MSEDFYHQGSKALQQQMGSERLAARLEQRTVHHALTSADRAFIEGVRMFFLGTASPDGQPDVSYKGGPPGFVRILDDSTLAFPDYDGNGMFRSLGNLLDNPRVSMLFVDFERPRRLRVLGRATALADDPLLLTWAGAQLVVRVCVTHLFPNCPRYIHRLEFVAASPYTPEPGQDALEPDWKARFADVLPKKS